MCTFYVTSYKKVKNITNNLKKFNFYLVQPAIFILALEIGKKSFIYLFIYYILKVLNFLKIFKAIYIIKILLFFLFWLLQLSNLNISFKCTLYFYFFSHNWKINQSSLLNFLIVSIFKIIPFRKWCYISGGDMN